MKKYAVYVVVFLCGIMVFFLQFDYGKKYQPYTFYQVYLDDERIGVIKSKEELEHHISRQGNIIQNQVIEYQAQTDTIDIVNKAIEKTIKKGNAYYQQYVSKNNLENNYLKLHKYVDDEGNLIGNYDELKILYGSFSPIYIDGTSLTTKGIVNYNLLQERFDSNIRNYEKNLTEYLYDNRSNLSLTSSEYNAIEEYHNNKLIDVTNSKYVTMLDYVEDNNIYLHTKDIYEPLGISIKKITTYDPTYMKVEDVYDAIIEHKPCTIEGYQFRIKRSGNVTLTDNVLYGALANVDYQQISKENNDDILIYVTDEKIFNDAINDITNVFVGEDNYQAYMNDTQKEITTTGTRIDNIYLEDDITFKKTNISVKEKIYTDKSELSSYLLYGDEIDTKTVYATAKDTVEDLAYRNKISVEEFFLSNPSFTSLDSIFYDGQPITITKLNPKINLVVEEFQVEDHVVNYDTIERYDSSMTVGSEYVEQKGEKGIVRTSQTIHKVNGVSLYAEAGSISNETIKPTKNQIIRVGTRNVPSIGSVRNWLWPTNSYSISSPYGYRGGKYDKGARGFHYGLDISNKKGAPVYASNNGTVVTRTRHDSYGNYIIINHNNGYYSLYAHMSGFAKGIKVGSVVARGQTIGYVGMTGDASGPHVHFEIRVGKNDTNHVVNPRPYLSK